MHTAAYPCIQRSEFHRSRAIWLLTSQMGVVASSDALIAAVMCALKAKASWGVCSMILEFVPEAALQAKLVDLLEAAVAYRSHYDVIFCIITTHNFTVRSTTPQRMNVLHRAILYNGDVAVVKAILHVYPALSFDTCSADSGGETFTVSRVGNRRIEMPSMAGYTALAMFLLTT